MIVIKANSAGIEERKNKIETIRNSRKDEKVDESKGNQSNKLILQ